MDARAPQIYDGAADGAGQGDGRGCGLTPIDGAAQLTFHQFKLAIVEARGADLAGKGPQHLGIYFVGPFIPDDEAEVTQGRPLRPTLTVASLADRGAQELYFLLTVGGGARGHRR